MDDFIKKLKHQLSQPLPGIEAQAKMSSFRRKMKDFNYAIPEIPKREAAVMCLLFPKNNQWHIALIERAAHEKDKHSGQISFPGGKYEESDKTYKYAALRETEEEIGIPMNDMTVIGKLTQLYIPVSDYLVHPFVAYCSKAPIFTPEINEVALILQPSIEHLLNPNTIQEKTFNSPNGWELKDVLHYSVEGKIVWGATSMILSEFLAVVENIN
ncbi:MAG: NUDIX hydrolase [Saprospiraceae bacterium]